MKLFKYPFTKRNMLALISPTEGVAFATANLSAVITPGSKRSYSFSDKVRHLRNFILRGNWFDFGVISKRMVTTEGVFCIANSFNANAEEADVKMFKYHAVGLGTAAEAVGDSSETFTSLQGANGSTTTAVTGSQASTLASANATYTTVGVFAFNASLAITEHGIFMGFNLGASPELLDRSKFAALNVISGDSITFTYVLQINSGG
jgi:hypothetical protein